MIQIPLIALPIAWTCACLLVSILWPKDRGSNWVGDIGQILIAAATLIAALVGWIVYLVLR